MWFNISFDFDLHFDFEHVNKTLGLQAFVADDNNILGALDWQSLEYCE